MSSFRLPAAISRGWQVNLRSRPTPRQFLIPNHGRIASLRCLMEGRGSEVSVGEEAKRQMIRRQEEIQKWNLSNIKDTHQPTSEYTFAQAMSRLIREHKNQPGDNEDVLDASNFHHAIALLNTLQSNHAIKSLISAAPNTKNSIAILEMIEWLRRAGYAPEDITSSGLRCIHVAGSSGKGSTCAMIDSILHQYRDPSKETDPLGKIGLYTSPHLIDVRERIRINGKKIPKAIFMRYLAEIWDRFNQAAKESNIASTSLVEAANAEIRPGYFRFLTILAFHIFMKEGVKTAIIECGIGGEYDSTNILPAEAVSVGAITRLELDHIGMLGKTIEDIAWHKGGIIKENATIFTSPQQPEAMAVLEERASDRDSTINTVARLSALENGKITLGLLGDFQLDNASLAVEVAANHLYKVGVTGAIPLLVDNPTLPRPFIRGLETVSWPGRCEIRKQGNVEYYLDGAHTQEAMKAVGEWFASKVVGAHRELKSRPSFKTMLVFNQNERDGKALLKTLLTTFYNATRPYLDEGFDYAAFCPSVPFTESNDLSSNFLSAQEELLQVYQTNGSMENCAVYPSVEEVANAAEGLDQKVFVLVTGSLHLVGSMYQYMDAKKIWSKESGGNKEARIGQELEP